MHGRILLSYIFWNLFVVCCYSQSVIKSYEKRLQDVERFNIENPEKAKEILLQIEKTNDFRDSDSLKTTVFLLWGLNAFYDNNLELAIKYAKKSIEFGEKTKYYEKLVGAYHTRAESLSILNKIDSALVYDKIALKYAKQAKNKKSENIIAVSIARKLVFKGDYQKSNEILFKTIDNLTEEEYETKGVIYATVAANYKSLSIQNLSEEYFIKSIYNLKKTEKKQMVSNVVSNLVDFYNTYNDYDKALGYIDSITYFSNSDYSKTLYNYHKSKSYKGLKKWGLAIRFIDKAIELDRLRNDKYGEALDLILKGQIYMEEGNIVSANETFKASKIIFEKENIDDLVMEKQLYRDYVSSYLKINEPSLAKDYEHFLNINDTLTFQSADKNLVELEAKYNFSQKESKIAQQQLQIEKETNRRNLALGSVGLILFLSFGGFLWFRNKQKNKELQNQNTLLSLQQNLNEMELSNLNKQLDPHEIKNLLASISPEIQDKAPEAYKKMIKLLNITKAGLNSNSLTETVENQVKQIDDFLSLEKQMSSKEFEYEISNQITDSSVKIPRLLLKNLVENSIKHGIRKKDNGGKIQVQIVDKDSYIHITVDDTGIGRKFVISQDSGIGTSTYIKLFETLNKKNNNPATFEILDKDEGTKVEVRIPRAYRYE